MLHGIEDCAEFVRVRIVRAMSTLSDRLDDLMRHHGIRGQSQLARETGVGQSTINRMLKRGDAYSPSWDTLRRLANYFNVSIEWLAEGRGQPLARASLLSTGAVTVQELDDQAQMGELEALVGHFQRLRPEVRGLVLALMQQLAQQTR